MHRDVQEILLTKEQIAERVRQLGRQIAEDYEGKDLVMVGILKGAVVFFSDLIREISIPMSVDFMAISSYGNATRSAGVVRFIKDLDKDILGKDVVIVEDIVDTGLTLDFLRGNLITRGAKSLRICALLDKPDRRKVDIRADYQGFVIPDAFVIGYGLDFNERYRNMPYIGILKPEVYQQV